jgi:hypothetical protein
VGLSTRYVHAILGFQPGGAPVLAEHASFSIDASVLMYIEIAIDLYLSSGEGLGRWGAYLFFKLRILVFIFRIGHANKINEVFASNPS